MLNAKIAGNLFKILQKRHIISHPKWTKITHVVSKILTVTFSINSQLTLRSLTSRRIELLENCSTHINVGAGVET